MAQVVSTDSETIEVRFMNAKGENCCLCFDNASQRDAKTIQEKIEHIVNRQINNIEVDSNVAQWLAELPDTLHAEFVQHGLTADRDAEESRETWTLGPWTEKYISERRVTDSTKRQLRSAARTLCEFFGSDRELNSVTISDAANYRIWMETEGNQQSQHTRGLAKNTVRKKISRAKQFFNSAVKQDLITSNPFCNEISTVTKPERNNKILCHLLKLAPYLLIGALIAAKYFGLIPPLGDEF